MRNFKNLKTKIENIMMFEKQKPYRKYTILVWGIVIIICGIFTYIMQFSMSSSSSSYAFFLIIGPIFLVIGVLVLIIGIIKAKGHKEIM